MEYQRPLLKILFERISEPRKFIQVIAGPRQVGKTTMALALRNKADGLAEYHSADDVVSYGAHWIDQIWESLRIRMKLEQRQTAVLIVDELQKISDWSAAVKRNWDRDTRENIDIRLVLLGSSRMLLMDGLSESLMGRFELSYAGHWSYAEMRDAFGFSPEQYQWFGGYPGAAGFVGDEPRFKEYVRNAIIEPTMIRDILMTAKIDKPALLRQLFEISVGYSTQIMSFNKMLGQLHDAGNSTTLAKYLKLLDQAGLLSGLNKYNKRIVESKGSIPKFQVHNTALMSAMNTYSFNEAIANRTEWGRVVESSVGAHLVNQINMNPNSSLYYWRENGAEVDYVVAYGNRVIGIEVKSGDESITKNAADIFTRRFPDAKLILVGNRGIPYEVFMAADLRSLFAAAINPA